jgi:hypothetical protein
MTVPELNLNRVFNDRITFDGKAFHVIENSFVEFLKRIIYWIFSPASYTQENQNTIQCFQKYLLDTLGADRLKRICSRYSLDLDAMHTKGNPLLSRDVAKIIIGSKNINVQDINDALKMKGDSRTFQELDYRELESFHKELSSHFDNAFKVPEIQGEIGGAPTEFLARIFFDPFLADRERLQLAQEHLVCDPDTFMHNMTAAVIKREMDVGTLVLANEKSQYYYVSAKIITGRGMVSYILHPATQDTKLDPIRLFRGTAPRNSEIDGISSIITDLEKDLGRTAYESGNIYESHIQKCFKEAGLTVPKIEAGHSLGSTLVQYRLAHLDYTYDTAYLFSGPGIPKADADKFKAKKSPVQLKVFQAEGDAFSKTGQVHLGQDTEHYTKLHPPKKKRGNPHTTVYSKRPNSYHGVEGGISPQNRKNDFNHEDKFKERLRSNVGPFVATALRLARDASRAIFSSRVEKELGLQIGRIENGKWKVDRFVPVAL